jgi:hypothetical protein
MENRQIAIKSNHILDNKFSKKGFIETKIWWGKNVHFVYLTCSKTSVTFYLCPDPDTHSSKRLDLDPHSSKRLDLVPDPHSSKRLDPDLHIFNADTKHWLLLCWLFGFSLPVSNLVPPLHVPPVYCTKS